MLGRSIRLISIERIRSTVNPSHRSGDVPEPELAVDELQRRLAAGRDRSAKRSRRTVGTVPHGGATGVAEAEVAAAEAAGAEEEAAGAEAAAAARADDRLDGDGGVETASM